MLISQQIKKSEFYKLTDSLQQNERTGNLKKEKMERMHEQDFEYVTWKHQANPHLKSSL